MKIHIIHTEFRVGSGSTDRGLVHAKKSSGVPYHWNNYFDSLLRPQILME